MHCDEGKLRYLYIMDRSRMEMLDSSQRMLDPYTRSKTKVKARSQARMTSYSGCLVRNGCGRIYQNNVRPSGCQWANQLSSYRIVRLRLNIDIDSGRQPQTRTSGAPVQNHRVPPSRLSQMRCSQARRSGEVGVKGPEKSRLPRTIALIAWSRWYIGEASDDSSGNWQSSVLLMHHPLVQAGLRRGV